MTKNWGTEEGMPKPEVCYRVEDETGKLELEEKWEIEYINIISISPE